MDRVERKPTFFDRMIDDLGALILVVMMFLITLQVVCRYILKVPLSWSEELARYLLIFLAGVGSAMAMRTGAHVVIETFVKKLPPGWRRVHKYFDSLCLLIFLGLILRYGTSFALLNMGQRSPGMPWLSMFWPCITIPFGMTLMIFYVFGDLFKREK